MKFPGGHIEVSRHSDGSYWVHCARTTAIGDPDADVLGEIVESRIDYTHEAYLKHGKSVPSMPAAEDIQHFAVRIATGQQPAPKQHPEQFSLIEP